MTAHPRSAVRAGLMALVSTLAGCTPSPVDQATWPVATAGAPASSAEGDQLPEDPAVAEAEAFGTATHPVVLRVQTTSSCPSADTIATATGLTSPSVVTGDPTDGCSYALDGGSEVTVTFEHRPLADTRAAVAAPTGYGQRLLVELDGAVAPGSYGVLVGADGRSTPTCSSSRPTTARAPGPSRRSGPPEVCPSPSWRSPMWSRRLGEPRAGLCRDPERSPTVRP